jgi:hypothetical protein
MVYKITIFMLGVTLEFLAADLEVLISIPDASRFSEK